MNQPPPAVPPDAPLPVASPDEENAPLTSRAHLTLAEENLEWALQWYNDHAPAPGGDFCAGCLRRGIPVRVGMCPARQMAAALIASADRIVKGLRAQLAAEEAGPAQAGP